MVVTDILIITLISRLRAQFYLSIFEPILFCFWFTFFIVEINQIYINRSDPIQDSWLIRFNPKMSFYIAQFSASLVNLLVFY